MNEPLEKLYKQWANEKADIITPLPKSGSYRRFFRMKSKNHNAIGVFNADKKENNAYITFSNHFFEQGLSVPELYSSNGRNDVYLIEDLGDETLFSYISENRKEGELQNEGLEYYKSALRELIKFQIHASRGLDYSVCYPRSSFDQRSMMWDLNYFKYYFLKLTQTPFNEQKLENDFNSLIEFLLSTATDFFMYRDFQSRNIMIKDNKLYFIDYQGGRKGALQYDVASLLYDAKANLSQPLREDLLNYYISLLEEDIKINKDEFIKYYYGYVLIRILQAMGAYGFRGIHENKTHFLRSIPYSVNNIKYLLNNGLLPEGLEELRSALTNITQNQLLNLITTIEEADKLIVSINSFSYKSGIPGDLSGNGGGFVFDCRSLNNPGRIDEFKSLTGKDKAVIEFLDAQNDIKNFIADSISIIKRSVNNYSERGFNHLMINYGCTGGQHRSVYCAERLAEYLKQTFDVKVKLQHTELEKKASH
jgi:aminoglycoside/choline kinase family phosphotransferase